MCAYEKKGSKQLNPIGFVRGNNLISSQHMDWQIAVQWFVKSLGSGPRGVDKIKKRGEGRGEEGSNRQTHSEGSSRLSFRTVREKPCIRVKTYGVRKLAWLPGLARWVSPAEECHLGRKLKYDYGCWCVLSMLMAYAFVMSETIRPIINLTSTARKMSPVFMYLDLSMYR